MSYEVIFLSSDGAKNSAPFTSRRGRRDPHPEYVVFEGPDIRVGETVQVFRIGRGEDPGARKGYYGNAYIPWGTGLVSHVENLRWAKTPQGERYVTSGFTALVAYTL